MTKNNTLKFGFSLENFHEFDRAQCDGKKRVRQVPNKAITLIAQNYIVGKSLGNWSLPNISTQQVLKQ